MSAMSRERAISRQPVRHYIEDVPRLCGELRVPHPGGLRDVPLGQPAPRHPV